MHFIESGCNVQNNRAKVGIRNVGGLIIFVKNYQFDNIFDFLRFQWLLQISKIFRPSIVFVALSSPFLLNVVIFVNHKAEFATGVLGKVLFKIEIFLFLGNIIFAMVN